MRASRRTVRVTNGPRRTPRPNQWPSTCPLLPQEWFKRSGIFRLVARLPLDVAADARLLRRRYRRAGEHRIRGRTQVGAGDRMTVARPALVELTAIHEAAIAIEQEEIRSA